MLAQDADNPIVRLLGALANYLLAILIAAATVAIIIAGFYFLTAQGDPNKVGDAKRMVTYAIIAVLVGMTAYAMTKLVRTIVESGIN